MSTQQWHSAEIRRRSERSTTAALRTAGPTKFRVSHPGDQRTQHEQDGAEDNAAPFSVRYVRPHRADHDDAESKGAEHGEPRNEKEERASHFNQADDGRELVR